MRNILKIISKQKGFTLIEIVIGVALLSIVGAAIAAGLTQTFAGSALSSNRMTAVNNVRDAGDWISQDAKMSITISITDDCPTFNWTYYDPISMTPPLPYSVVYTTSGTSLIRTYIIDGVTQSEIVVASNVSIESGSTTFAANTFSITLTSTVGSVQESRTFKISLRNLPQ